MLNSEVSDLFEDIPLRERGIDAEAPQAADGQQQEEVSHVCS